MNNDYYSKWVKLNNTDLPIGLCENDYIKCLKCDFITHPTVIRYKINNLQYGKLQLPQRCPICNRVMLK